MTVTVPAIANWAPQPVSVSAAAKIDFEINVDFIEALFKNGDEKSHINCAYSSWLFRNTMMRARQVVTR